MKTRKLATAPIRGAFFAAISLVFALMVPGTASAHPMGNFSVSHFSGIRIAPGAVELRYILDLAEIPTFQEMQATGIVADPGDPRVTAYLSRKAESLKAALVMTLEGKTVMLDTVSEDVIFPPGAGGLPTMKIGVVYRAPLTADAFAAGVCTLDYRDGNLPDRAGWKEIVATADPGVAIRSSTAPAGSRSQELASYPTDLINSPPQDLSARLTFVTTAGLTSMAHRNSAGKDPADRAASKASNLVHSSKPLAPRQTESASMGSRSPVSRSPGNGPSLAAAPQANRSDFAIRVATPQPRRAATRAVAANATGQAGLVLKKNQQGTPRNRFTELIASNQWGLWFLLTAALIAAALGGLHALEPGHGKTIVAAYLVGSQGTAAHALWLGLTVTLTHTAGVYALGLVTLYASKYIVPDHLYPWLGVTSGLTIAALGLYMLQRRYAGHLHGHNHDHHHGWIPHSHGSGHDLNHMHGVFGHSHTHDRGHDLRAHTHPHTHAGHGHDHAGHDQAQSHAHDHHRHDHSHNGTSSFSYRQLIALGVTGGIVPCPAALVVLLSAVSLHRVAFGLYLILAFSLGLAAVLISIGMVTVYARRLLARVPAEGPVINRWLPMASAAVVTCLGIAIVFQGLVSMGVVHVRL